MELDYADHLQKTQTEWESRWENVRELITFATESTPNPPTPTPDNATSGVDAENPVAITAGELSEQKPEPNLSANDSYFDDTESLPDDDSLLTEDSEM